MSNKSTLENHSAAQPNPGQRNRDRRRRAAVLLRRLMPAAAVAVMGLAAGAPVASAASTTPGDFSALVPNNPQVGYLDNCKVEIGVVFDTFGRYRKIGGARVNCTSVHRIIKATVWQQYWNGSSAVNVGASNVGARYNQAGSGNGVSGILRSGPVCGAGYYYRTEALVQTENTGHYFTSNWVGPAGGC